jgi:hypothetical protein
MSFALKEGLMKLGRDLPRLRAKPGVGKSLIDWHGFVFEIWVASVKKFDYSGENDSVPSGRRY